MYFNNTSVNEKLKLHLSRYSLLSVLQTSSCRFMRLKVPKVVLIGQLLDIGLVTVGH